MSLWPPATVHAGLERNTLLFEWLLEDGFVIEQICLPWYSNADNSMCHTVCTTSELLMLPVNCIWTALYDLLYVTALELWNTGSTESLWAVSHSVWDKIIDTILKCWVSAFICGLPSVLDTSFCFDQLHNLVLVISFYGLLDERKHDHLRPYGLLFTAHPFTRSQ